MFALCFGLTSESHENADNRLMRHTVCSMTNVAQSRPLHALYIQECEKTHGYILLGGYDIYHAKTKLVAGF